MNFKTNCEEYVLACCFDVIVKSIVDEDFNYNYVGFYYDSE